VCSLRQERESDGLFYDGRGEGQRGYGISFWKKERGCTLSLHYIIATILQLI